MKRTNLVHLPHFWSSQLQFIKDCSLPIIFIIMSFYVGFLPIRSLFPGSVTPDIPAIILFCLLFHRFAFYFVPLFFLCMIFTENIMMIPFGIYLVHYSIFYLFARFFWGHKLTSDISFWVLYFYFAMTYIVVLLADFIIFSMIYDGFFAFAMIFRFWFATIIMFPAIFHIFYYLCIKRPIIIDQDAL